MTVPSPTSVRQAGAAVAFEGAAALVVAVVLVVLYLSESQHLAWLNGLGTAIWFAIMGAGVLTAGWALWTGRRWGRGMAVFAQLLLLPVAYYMAVGSGQWALGVPVGLVAVIVLALLFSRSALEWVAAQPGPASADNSGPDTR